MQAVCRQWRKETSQTLRLALRDRDQPTMPYVQQCALAKSTVLAMKLQIYEQLLRMNHGFQQVLKSLHELAKLHPRQAVEIQRFEQFAKENRSATNSYLLEVLQTKETRQAGRLFRKRRTTEQREK